MIYFIHDKRYDIVKIGYTVNLKSRFSEIKTYYGASWSLDLEVLAVLECDSAENASLEKEMHKRFHHLVVDRHPKKVIPNTDYSDGRFNATRKEWFRFTDELRDFVECVKRGDALSK